MTESSVENNHNMHSLILYNLPTVVGVIDKLSTYYGICFLGAYHSLYSIQKIVIRKTDRKGFLADLFSI